MSVGQYVTVMCDAPGCDEESDAMPTVRQARLVARDLGWTHRRTVSGRYVDLCPGHEEEARRG